MSDAGAHRRNAVLIDGKGAWGIQFVSRIEPQMVLDAVRNFAPENIRHDTGPFPLPRGTRFVDQSREASTYIVVELEPGRHILKHRSFPRAFNLAMPWQYFMFQVAKPRRPAVGITNILDNIWLVWAERRLESMDEPVWSSAIPNVGFGGGVCLGSTITMSGDAPLYKRIEDIVASFYTPESVFNDDLNYRLPYDTFALWQAASRADEFVWKKWHFSDFWESNTLNGIIGNYLDEEPNDIEEEEYGPDGGFIGYRHRPPDATDRLSRFISRINNNYSEVIR